MNQTKRPGDAVVAPSDSTVTQHSDNQDPLFDKIFSSSASSAESGSAVAPGTPSALPESATRDIERSILAERYPEWQVALLWSAAATFTSPAEASAVRLRLYDIIRYIKRNRVEFPHHFARASTLQLSIVDATLHLLPRTRGKELTPPIAVHTEDTDK